MSYVFKQTGLTQQITTTGATAWLTPAKSFNQVVGAVRVVNVGPNPAQIAVWDEDGPVDPPATLADGTPSLAQTLLPNEDIMLGPFQGQVFFNAAGAAGQVVQFTPGSCAR